MKGESSPAYAHARLAPFFPPPVARPLRMDDKFRYNRALRPANTFPSVRGV